MYTLTKYVYDILFLDFTGNRRVTQYMYIYIQKKKNKLILFCRNIFLIIKKKLIFSDHIALFKV